MKLKPFDILFHQGTSPIAKIIKAFTGSPYSHVGLILDDKHIVEINWSYKLKIRHIKYPDSNFQIYRLKTSLTNEQQDQIYTYMYSTLDSKYDFKEILSIVLYRLFKIKPKNNIKKFVCSSWINECFKSCGVVLNENDLVSPKDLISEKLQLIEYRDIETGDVVIINRQNRTL